MSIHEKIKALRKAAKLSQLALAQRVSSHEPSGPPITRQTVEHWENGSTAPKRTRLPAVAAALGTSVAYLLAATPGDSAAESIPDPIALAQALEVLGQALACGMSDEQRTEVGTTLLAWAHLKGSDRYRGKVAALLAKPAAAPEKRQATG